MTTDNLKYSLLDKLISVKDERVLEKINELIADVDLNGTIFKTTEAQRQQLSQSESDIQKGNTITDDRLNEEEERWLKE